MRSVGWAFAWEYWARNRILTGLALAYLLALVLFANILPADTLEPEGVASLTLPLWWAVLQIIAVANHGHSDLMERQAAYPRRAFRLPLPAPAVVGWQLALEAGTLALCWLVVGALVLWPAGVSVPLVWPAAFLAALVAWGQALMWSPFPLPGLRIFAAL